MLADEMQQMNPMQTALSEASRILIGDIARKTGGIAISAVKAPFNVAFKLARMGIDAYKNRHLKAEINYKKLSKYAEKTHSSLMPAKCMFTEKQMQEFAKLAKEYKIPFSAIKNKQPDARGSFEYHLVFRDKDLEMVKMVQEIMIRNKLKRDKAADALMNDPGSFNDISNEKMVDNIMDGEENIAPISDFDKVLDCFSAKNEEISPENPLYICDRNDPNAYIELTAHTDSHDGREYLVSKFDLNVGGVKQRCDEFPHGEFTHYSRMDGGNETPEGAAHWRNMKNELKEKGGFSNDILVFASKKDHDAYTEFHNLRNAEEKNRLGETYKQRKDRFTEELGKLDGNIRTDAALQSILREQIKVNQNMARTERQINDTNALMMHESDPAKREVLDKKKNDLQKQLDAQKEKLNILENKKDALYGIKFLDKLQAEKNRQKTKQTMAVAGKFDKSHWTMKFTERRLKNGVEKTMNNTMKSALKGKGR